MNYTLERLIYRLTIHEDRPPPNGVNGAGGLQNHVTVGGQSGSQKMSRDTPCWTDHVVTWVPESVLDDEFRDSWGTCRKRIRISGTLNRRLMLI